MLTSERKGFNNGIQVMREVFGLSGLSDAAVDQYWLVLKDFSSLQFREACRKLMSKCKEEYGYGKTFPLPGDFLEAIPKGYHLPYQPEPDADETNGVRYDVLMPKLLKLMPQSPHFNSDEEAKIMVDKMNKLVDLEFSKLPK